MAKKEIPKKPFFKCNLELMAIDKKEVRYRVVNPKGVSILSLHHLEFHREIETSKGKVQLFPQDDDFSLDFLAADLDKIKPYTDKEIERLSEIEKKKAEKGLEFLKEKQAKFRKFAKLELTIHK